MLMNSNRELSPDTNSPARGGDDPLTAVVVGVDGSASSTQAVLWAAREAGRRHAPLVIVHVWTMIPVAPRHVGSLRAYHDALVEQGDLVVAGAHPEQVDVEGEDLVEALDRDAEGGEVDLAYDEPAGVDVLLVAALGAVHARLGPVDRE